jgi:two-component system, LuxR family, sensor kinase FixL
VRSVSKTRVSGGAKGKRAVTAPRPELDDKLLREQAAIVAHYKKMYDRSSALAKIGVWECELATEKLTWTDGVYDLFELPRGSPIERARIVEMYEPDSRREMERKRARAIRTGGSFGLDIVIRTGRGKRRWLRLTADVEREDGQSVRIFGTKQDITESKIAQEKLKALQAELIQVSRKSAMGTMAATLAHELNQPLAAIGNYAAGLRRALGGEEPSRAILGRGVEAIEASALRAGGIIRSLREIASGSAITGRRFDPSGLIREAAGLALANCAGAVILHFRFAGGVEISADPVQFQQVMINLIRNAAEAVETAPRREVTIATVNRGSGVEIRVDDSGPGIAPELMANVFDAFVSSKPGGMGVGLAISRTIVEAHGGRISAANGAAGGASFRLYFPVPTRSEKAAAVDTQQATRVPARVGKAG